MRRYLTVQSSLGLFAALLLVMIASPARSGDPQKAASPRPDPKALAAPISDADKKLPTDDDFVVHEWGTFTSFSGSDGVALDFRTTATADLPTFVLDRTKQAFISERRDIAYRTGRGEKGTIISKQRMETPVTYFYSDRERLVDVTVEFPRGLLTEFYPPVRQFGPAYKKDQSETPLENSWLRWGKIRLLPADKAIDPKTGVDPYIRKITAGEDEHYAYARDVDATTVQITDPAMLATYRERFLFYRGVGNFDLPVSLRSRGDGHFTMTHSGKSPLRYAFLMQVGADGQAIRFARYENVLGSTEMTLPSQADTLDHLAAQVTQCLMSDGLYEKEARAMVRTWRSSWFGEPGTRVLYSLPRESTDALLPLRLDPAPKELVRVMVGRLEALTVEDERSIGELVAQLGNADPAVREQKTTELRRLGRFAEPALARAAQLSEDPEIRLRAQSLTREILAGKPGAK
jgi:hypothetical protein